MLDAIDSKEAAKPIPFIVVAGYEADIAVTGFVSALYFTLSLLVFTRTGDFILPCQR